ncbi:MAG: hypothetical protein ABJQ29_12120 [Luteolibacter sp.]
MEFLDKWERKLGWMAFPGLLRYCAIFQVVVYLLQIVNPQIGYMLDFDRSKILSGEVWRVVTFLFSASGSMGLGGFSLLVIYFTVIIAFMVSDGLEEAWGTFRTSLFCYVGFAGLLLANYLYSLITPYAIPATGLIFYGSAFFAFATLFPRVELMLFLIIPVQVRWLALFQAVLLVVSVFQSPLFIGFVILGYGNYLLWAGIPGLRGQARVVSSIKRKRNFDKAKPSSESAFHCCATCKKTELSDPELEFRMAEDGNEYCADHIPE